ncbi:hypothetical protein QCA50_015127 [Cerrena zonata]|uniref:Peptidase A1 domain-containing protein n=1 Tax=Cerrena zonata TaxID=2478898 RepID=A0AAW0FK30_9APHY
MGPPHLMSLLLLVGVILLGADALRVPLTKRVSTSDAVQVVTHDLDEDPYGFKNLNNVRYTGLIHVSGKPFNVVIDTGSSDLWVDTKGSKLDNITDTGIAGSIRYVDETGASGNIKLADVTWGDWTVFSQAFIDAPGANASSGSVKGILGVGPPTLSNVDRKLSSSDYDGSSFLESIFTAYQDKPNCITFYLSRNTVGATDGGLFTISEVLDDFNSILDEPKLPVVSSSRWYTFMDSFLINGQYYGADTLNQQSSIEVPENKTLVLLDTGNSLARAPPFIVDHMYKVPGAFFSQKYQTYILPCDTKVNVSIVFGDSEYPINPLDLTLPYGIRSDESPMCRGTFGYTRNSTSSDVSLGDVFLRNTYSLFEFGNWTNAGDGEPYIQLLSVTDPEAAWSRFDKMNQARLDAYVSSKKNTTSSTSASSSPSRSASPSDSVKLSGALGDTDENPDVSTLVRLNYIMFGLLGLVILLLIGTIGIVSSKNRRSQGKSYKPLTLQTPEDY